MYVTIDDSLEVKCFNEMTHSLYVVDLLKELKRKGIGTNAIQHQIAKLCEKGEGREKILEIVMNYRIKAAHKEVRRLKYENMMTWRENDDALTREEVLDRFMVIWAKEKTRDRLKLKELRKKKVYMVVRTWREWVSLTFPGIP